MAKTTITINDIARELNVAPSTVSRALNNSNKISEKTKDLIRDKAAELGYDLNMVASSLSRKQTNIIGVMVPSVNRHFFSQVVSGIEELAYDAGYRIIIAQTNELAEREKDILTLFNSTRVDGIIACLSLETSDVTRFSKILKNGIPLVLIDRVSYELDCPKIVVDNHEGAFQAVSHLVRSGCKRIAHLGGPMGCPVFKERSKGYLDAMQKAGLPIHAKYHLSTDLSTRDVQEAMKVWMSMPEPPDGIFTSDSHTGLVATKIATESGLRVPEEISFVAFGDDPAHEYIVPSLSSIEVPGNEMGRSAMQLILEQCLGESIDVQTIIKPIQLIIRSSSFR
ncbi:LacI family DNA-binding transcriptional regulator [Natronoflexus pectinivorans]|uniref:LacI family transcriptional regulator n=1 Tax=Natronoflexus pectinivorans TaxID=682526 RepID=A0A4R2GDF3_9BACT|nr:LacI family DNA-binding transcriptional regulator [Natronoflexus pectinivorans]TCO06097.1 LacI family transcriptional regulator [Natronoflexus pectinivorans]